MALRRFDRRKRNLFLGFYAVAYAVAMLLLGGVDFERLYAASPYHRLQADALLQGHLHIGDSVRQLRHDLAWHGGRVNHVWGLGVGLWLAPFEAVWRLFGLKWFPDRLALGVACGLLAWGTGLTGWRLGERFKSPPLGIGFVWLILFCPALWTLNYGPRLIYEETSLYAVLVSLGILVCTVQVALDGNRSAFWIGALLAGFAAIVRPTHGIYGVAGMLVTSALLLVRGGGWRTVLGGNAVFIGGLVFLAATNWARFGSPTEFGHRLTVTPDLIVYTTRLKNDMAPATTMEAARELFGFLFLLGDLKKENVSEGLVVPGQAPYDRWRDPYMSSFDLGWAAVCAVGALGGIIRLRRHWQRSGMRSLLTQRSGGAAAGVWGFGLITAAGLAVFYLRLATLSVRYLLDFAPAFTALALVVWLGVTRRSWVMLAVLGGWLGYEIMTVQFVPSPVSLLKREAIADELAPVDGRGLGKYEGTYTPTNHPSATGIAYNGYGWEEGTGEASHVAILALDKPDFVELVVGRRIADAGAEPKEDVFHAMIDNQFLPVESIRKEEAMTHVRFSIPEQIRRRRGDEIVFLWFGRNYSKEERESRRPLHSVRWRE